MPIKLKTMLGCCCIIKKQTLVFIILSTIYAFYRTTVVVPIVDMSRKEDYYIKLRLVFILTLECLIIYD